MYILGCTEKSTPRVGPSIRVRRQKWMTPIEKPLL